MSLLCQLKFGADTAGNIGRERAPAPADFRDREPNRDERELVPTCTRVSRFVKSSYDVCVWGLG
jgi:hypothetical protein